MSLISLKEYRTQIDEDRLIQRYLGGSVGPAITELLDEHFPSNEQGDEVCDPNQLRTRVINFGNNTLFKGEYFLIAHLICGRIAKIIGDQELEKEYEDM